MSYVTKRNGKHELISFDKITERISKLITDEKLDPIVVSQKVIANLYSGISTQELDLYSAEICINLSTVEPGYALLGGKVLTSNLHKNTFDTFTQKMEYLYNIGDIDEYFMTWIRNNSEFIESTIDYKKDYVYDYFGFKTLEKGFLMKTEDGKPVERVQDVLMRTAIFIEISKYKVQNNMFNNDYIDVCCNNIKTTYMFLSNNSYVHATPTLSNAGKTISQLASCFLMGVDDSSESILKAGYNMGLISKRKGGIGLHFSDIRSRNSIIKGTRGRSNGIIPYLQSYEKILRAFDQGGSRPGAGAIYLETHHPDIEEFLNLRKNFGSETERARDLFLALWVSDLFMKQVLSGGDWWLLSPDDCPNLTNVHSEEYERLYFSYVEKNMFKKKMRASDLWNAILDTQIETGMPYIGFKDAVNRKCNQKNIGIIKSSNLCIEINQYSSDKEYAVCNLASISLKKCLKNYEFNLEDIWTIYVLPNCKYCNWSKLYLLNNNVTNINIIEYSDETKQELLKRINSIEKTCTYPQIFKNDELIGSWSSLYKYTSCTYDFKELQNIATIATINLNNVIDINYYPVKETKISNMKHRPIGLGIQGLADTLAMLRIPFDSDEAVLFNAKIMETIYFGAVTASANISLERFEDFNNFFELCYTNKIDYMEKIDEFYDNNVTFENLTINLLYHKLKPNIYELKNRGSTWIGAYSTFKGSPFSNGLLQFDLWNVEPSIYDWTTLKQQIMKYGIRNSMLTSLMPTASTSQLLSNNECFEYFTNNVYTRKTNAGDFMMVNKYLVSDLQKLNMWNLNLKNQIIASNGSIQNLLGVPDELKRQYKTIWEIKQIWVLKQAESRGPYVDQSQSMNIFMENPDSKRLNASHMCAWKMGLKTGMYYLRTKSASSAIKFTVDPKMIKDLECFSCSA